MKNEKPDNPNAFPTQEMDFEESAIQGRTVIQGEQSGMSLRDYFAAKAMQALITSPQFYGHVKDSDTCAELAYGQADAMLKERSKK